MYHSIEDVEALNDHGYKTNLEMLQSVNECLLILENQRKPSAKLLETLSSVDDMYHHSGPSFVRVLVLKPFCSIRDAPVDSRGGAYGIFMGWE